MLCLFKNFCELRSRINAWIEVCSQTNETLRTNIHESNFRSLPCWIKCNYTQSSLYQKKMKPASLYPLLQLEVTFFIPVMWLRYRLWWLLISWKIIFLCFCTRNIFNFLFSQGCGNCLWIQWNSKSKTSIPEATVIEPVQWSYSSRGMIYTKLIFSFFLLGQISNS